MDITCPVCELKSVSAEKTQCPQCDADLSCFRVLDNLPDNPKEEKNNLNTKNIVILIATLALFLSLISFLISLKDQQPELRFVESQANTELLTEIKKQLVYLHEINFNQNANFNQVKLEIEALTYLVGQLDTRQPSNSLTSPLEPRSKDIYGNLKFWIYTIKAQDSLWQLAEKYYGSGHYYPVLLEHNPNIGIHTIWQGMQLRILEDASLSKIIYPRITHKENNKIYWKYTITEDDTLTSIINKFSKANVQLITDANTDHTLEPGEQIKITLD